MLYAEHLIVIMWWSCLEWFLRVYLPLSSWNSWGMEISETICVVVVLTMRWTSHCHC